MELLHIATDQADDAGGQDEGRRVVKDFIFGVGPFLLGFVDHAAVKMHNTSRHNNVNSILNAISIPSQINSNRINSRSHKKPTSTTFAVKMHNTS